MDEPEVLLPRERSYSPDACPVDPLTDEEEEEEYPPPPDLDLWYSSDSCPREFLLDPDPEV